MKIVGEIFKPPIKTPDIPGVSDLFFKITPEQLIGGTIAIFVLAGIGVWIMQIYEISWWKIVLRDGKRRKK